jgi:hypothetical protein
MVSILIKSLMAISTKLLMSLASEKIIEWALFYLVESIVKSTKTTHDDEFYSKIKEAYLDGKGE